jgi:CubicO group peptidase (beta-lactamase class C family)
MRAKIIYEPGSKYLYSDLSMITLQLIIEKITGKSLDKYLKANVFDPLEMTRTMYNPPEKLWGECMPTEVDNYWRMDTLQGKVHDETAYLLGGVAGHAGVFSTAEDISKLIFTLLNHGQYKGKQLFSVETVENWTTKQSEQSTRGLGWDTKSREKSSAGHYFSMRSFGHTGFTGTSVWADKESGLFVVLLTNRVYPTRKNRKIIKFRPVIHDAIVKATEYFSE